MDDLTVFGKLLKPWIHAFMSAVSDFIPTKKIKGKNSLPWITREIIHTLPTDSQQPKYRELRAKAKTLISEGREIYFSSLDSDLERQPKRFWSFFKLKNKTRTFPETMSSGDDNQQGPQASTPQQITELVNSYFVSVFTAPLRGPNSLAPFTPSHPTLNELEIPLKIVLTSLKQLDINKATGSDWIPVRLLKETADQIAPSLILLFNKSLRLGIFPWDWKLANIVPIFKKGKRDFVENYRPISLLPLISKVLERCLLAGLRDHISHLISLEQHDFLAGRSCVTQLTSVLHYIGGHLDDGKQIDIHIYTLKWVRNSRKWIASDLEGYTNTALLANFMTGSVHTYRNASNRLQFSEPLPENCLLHPGYHKGPY